MLPRMRRSPRAVIGEVSTVLTLASPMLAPVSLVFWRSGVRGRTIGSCSGGVGGSDIDMTVGRRTPEVSDSSDFGDWGPVTRHSSDEEGDGEVKRDVVLTTLWVTNEYSGLVAGARSGGSSKRYCFCRECCLGWERSG